MTVYLDVGAGRVQTWIGRSSTLRGRRGASRLLADCTREHGTRVWLETQTGTDFAGVGWNHESGDVDGIVSLTLPGSAGDDQVERVARAVLRRLRAQLPRVDLAAGWYRADSYVEAYHHIQAGLGRLSDVGQPRSLPIAKICDDCHLDGAVHENVHIAGKDQKDLCADCGHRYPGAGWTTATKATRVPGPELDLATWLVKRLGNAGSPPVLQAAMAEPEPEHRIDAILRLFPDESEQLAAGTHTALIFADGNRIGDYVSARVASGDSKASIAGRVGTANTTAVVDATLEILGPVKAGARLPISPHLIAGDDLLLSVPAELAWPFVLTYLRRFGAGLGGQASTSAGVVFAHSTYPFADVVRLAAAALKKAKRATAGNRAAIARLDITEHGPNEDEIRVVELAALDQHEHDLAGLAREPASRRRGMVAALASGPARLDRERSRLGIRSLDPFLDEPAAIGPQDALDLVRWWR